MFEATLPAARCDDTPEFYVSAEGVSKSMVTNPVDAPTTVYTATVFHIEVMLEDDFETDQGWTTEVLGASSGQWMRGVPVNDPGWAYDPISDGDGSGQCWLTHNVTGNTDIDDGAVRLTSPVFAIAEGGVIRYDYYLYLTNEDGTDRLLVEINNNGGVGSWAIIANHTEDGATAWRSHEVTYAELQATGLLLTENMMVRFTANDGDPQSIVEAAVDGFEVVVKSCTDLLCGDVDNDGEGPLITDLTYLVAYLFSGGPAPEVPSAANIDGIVGPAGPIDVSDVTYLVAYLFTGGPDPICE